MTKVNIDMIKNGLNEFVKEEKVSEKNLQVLFEITLNNLKFANNSIKFYTQKNIFDNSYTFKDKKLILLNREFFNQPEEVVFRSLSEIIRVVGKKYYPVRGKKIDHVVELIKNKSFFKITLGNCILKRVNNTVIVSKES